MGHGEVVCLLKGKSMLQSMTESAPVATSAPSVPAKRLYIGSGEDCLSEEELNDLIEFWLEDDQNVHSH